MLFAFLLKVWTLICTGHFLSRRKAIFLNCSALHNATTFLPNVGHLWLIFIFDVCDKWCVLAHLSFCMHIFVFYCITSYYILKIDEYSVSLMGDSVLEMLTFWLHLSSLQTLLINNGDIFMVMLYYYGKLTSAYTELEWFFFSFFVIELWQKCCILYGIKRHVALRRTILAFLERKANPFIGRSGGRAKGHVPPLPSEIGDYLFIFIVFMHL